MKRFRSAALFLVGSIGILGLIAVEAETQYPQLFAYGEAGNGNVVQDSAGNRRRLKTVPTDIPQNVLIENAWLSFTVGSGGGCRQGKATSSSTSASWGTAGSNWNSYNGNSGSQFVNVTSQVSGAVYGFPRVTNYGWWWEAKTSSTVGSAITDAMLTYDLYAPGDANKDGVMFNNSDIVSLLQSGKYKTGQAATWSQGDFNGDNLFNESDITAIENYPSEEPVEDPQDPFPI